MRLRSFLTICLIASVSLSLWSQSQADYPAIARETNLLEGEQAANAKSEVQRRGIGERSRVKVTLRNKTEVKGYISQIDTNSFDVTDKKSGQSTTIPYEDAMKVRRNGMSTAAKIAIGAAVVAGTMFGLGAIAYMRRD
jgi:hypothetical protein